MCVWLFESVTHVVELIGERQDPPNEKLQLDRIENKGHYSCGKCPECLANGWNMNVKWSTAKENCRHKDNNLLFTIDGVTMCASAWAEQPGAVNRDTMYQRHHRLGWTDHKEIVFTPRRITSRTPKEYKKR